MQRILSSDWLAPLVTLGIAVVLISVLSPGFLSPLNMQVLLLAIAINGLIACAQMVIIAMGQMNLSIGSIGGLAAVSFAGAMQVWHLPSPVAALLAIIVGLSAGLVNGIVISWTKISAFVVTLASMSILEGLNMAMTQAKPFYDIPNEVKSMGNSTIWGIVPWLLVPCVLVFAAVWFALFRVQFGRQILAVGGNEQAAALSGISIPRVTISAHIMSGVLAALAGIALVARLQVGEPTIGGDWLILSFAGPVVGGAMLSGGSVSVLSTIIGVAIIAIITQALVLFSIDPFLVQVVLGALIISAVGIGRLRETRTERADRNMR